VSDLDQAARDLSQARASLAAAITAIRPLITDALDHGASEHSLAKQTGVTRVTIHRWRTRR
jgi:hypothetical protein